ncbi:MAG TPA: PASTA domain-containing protein [Acidobacteriota bacterium]
MVWSVERSLQAAALVGALILTAGLAAWIAMALVVVEPALTVPDLRRLAPEQARARLRALGLDLQVAAEVHSDSVPRGQIVVHEPEAGAPLKPGRAVRVQVSRGAARLQVPRLVGESLRQARLVLTHSGLKLGDIAQVHSPNRPAGTVLAQEPPGEAQTEPEDRVDLVVSLGRAETGYVMPDLIDRPFEPIARFLRARGFVLERVNRRGYPGLPPGVVIRQYPEPGFRLRRNTPIRLEISG